MLNKDTENRLLILFLTFIASLHQTIVLYTDIPIEGYVPN
jgi:hypothetical protein